VLCGARLVFSIQSFRFDLGDLPEITGLGRPGLGPNIEVDPEADLIEIFVVERPAGLEDEAAFFERRRSAYFREEFKRRVGLEYLLEQEIGLLAGHFVGKGDRLRKGDVDRGLGGKERQEQLGIIL
jgi:hypothetical protein